MSPLQDKLVAIAQPVVESFGCKLWWLLLQFDNRGKAVLRVYIDKCEASVNMDDCASVSQQLSRVLDIEDKLSESYTLEVSSPGLDRSLYRLEHYIEYLGHRIELSLKQPMNGQKKFKGILSAVEGSNIVLQVDEIESHSFAIHLIYQAKLTPFA